MTENGRLLLLRLTIRSLYDMLDFVQLVSDHIAAIAGLDDDSLHWLGVAIRETVINAIKHGNQQDEQKLVTLEFAFAPHSSPTQLVVTVRDQGHGFEPEEVADPLAPENTLKSSGRGIFFMRSFMDDVLLRRIPEGGMEVCLIKNLATPPAGLAPPA
jgi:serine/threonine-protein kinase RsbW